MPPALQQTSPRFLLISGEQQPILEAAVDVAGCRLVRAASIQDALVYLGNSDFAGVVIAEDQRDPVEIARGLRAQERSIDLPVVFITKPYDIALAGEVYAVGGVELLGSPVDAGALRAKIEAMAALWRTRCDLVAARRQVEALREELERRVVERTEQLEKEIAERRRIEATLRESEALYRSIGEAVPDLLWSCWADGSANFVNRRWMEYTGLTLEDAHMLPLEALHHPDDIPELRKRIADAAARKGPFEAEFRLKRHDGEYRWFMARAVPILNDGGEIIQWVGTSTDTHERRLNEERVRRHQVEIEALNARLQRAMAETHHRVRNNLQLIAALADMQVSEGSASVPVAELRRIGGQVRALAAVHDILTSQARTSGEAQDLSAREVLTNLIALIQESAGDIRIRADVGDIRLSARQGTSLAIVANELIMNAIKNSDQDVEVRFAVAEGRAQLDVLDAGAGFPHDFDPLLHANTGLELVQQVSRWDLNGEIRFENRPEGGGHVIVTMPVLSDTVAA